MLNIEWGEWYLQDELDKYIIIRIERVNNLYRGFEFGISIIEDNVDEK